MSVLVIRQVRHRSHTQRPLLDYQTKPTSDPGVAVVGQMRAKVNIKVYKNPLLQPSAQMPNWLSFVESGSVKTYGWFVFTEHKSQSDCNMKAGAGFLWEPGLWYLALSAAL